MKNTRPIKTGKEIRTTFFKGVPQKLKITNKVLIEKSNC